MMLLLVFLGGAVGAPTRYLTDRWVQSKRLSFPTKRRANSRQRVSVTLAELRFPFGTFAINAIGSLILGIVLGGVAHHGWSAHTQALLGTGFCGGLTTFSTFSVETVELLQGRLAARAAGYVALSCAVGIALAALGYQVIAA